MRKNEKTAEKRPKTPVSQQETTVEKNERKKPRVRKSRYFAFMTYAGERAVTTTLAKHQQSVRAFAYILHDKDEAEPHIHLVVRTYSTWTETQILKWFDWVKARDNQNTFVEVLNDTLAMGEYLTHDDAESVQKGKHRYDRAAIKDFGLFDIVDKKDAYDETYEIVCNVMAGTSERDLVRRYGKNYLFHRAQYHESADAIYTQQVHRRAEFASEERARLLEIDTDAVSLEGLLEG